MFQDNRESDPFTALDRENFFTNRPYRNFFQYPPINTPGEKGMMLNEILKFDTGLRSGDFTVFVSIPYCRVRCNSCPYFVALLPDNRDKEEHIGKYAQRLEAHLEHFTRSGRFSSGTCRAIYIGGGTASLLSPKQVARLLGILRDGLPFAADIEITLEGNPHEFSGPYLDAVRAAGVTRVSIGYQSSQDDILRDTLNSPHTANESLSALRAALGAGFDTVNVDLLYRLPGQTLDQWRRDVETVLELGPESVTTYEYIVHERTTAARRIAEGRMGGQSSRNEARSWYRWMRDRMLAEDYVEPSNHTFAKPGHHQRYSDLTYGQGTELIGLGAKAYSYVNGLQFMAPRTVPKYERAVDSGDFPVGEISLAPTRRNLMERYIIFSLRRGFGVDSQAFAERFGTTLDSSFRQQIDFLVENGTLSMNEGGIELTDLGREWKTNVLETFYDPRFLSSASAS